MGKRGPKPTKTAALGLRITEDTRKRLEAAAKRSGRSMSDEVEQRLLSSFGPEDRTADALLKLAGFALDDVDAFTGQSWVDDPYTFVLAAAVFAGIIKEFRPEGETKMPETILPVRAFRGADPATKRVRIETFERLAKEKPTVFAHGIVRVVVERLVEAIKGVDRPELRPYREVVDMLDGKLVAVWREKSKWAVGEIDDNETAGEAE